MNKANLNEIGLTLPGYVKADYYITGLLKYLSDEFNGEAVSKKLVEKYFNDASSKYYQMTQQQILDSWAANRDRALMIGNALDDYVGMRTEPENTKWTMDFWKAKVNYDNDAEINLRCMAWESYWKFLESNGWEMVGREIPLSMKVGGRDIGGRADMILCKDSHFLIIDWKTADEIGRDNFTKAMHGPVKGLCQDKLTTYGLQVAFYKIALRKMIADPNATIDTCIVQARSNGQLLRHSNPVSLNDADVLKILEWCIAQKDSEKTTSSAAPQPADNSNFKSSLAQLLSTYSLDIELNTDAIKLAQFISDVLDAQKKII